MDKYIREARVYPAILGMLPTCILLAMCMREWFLQCQVLLGNVKWVLCLIGGTALASMAVGYLVRELFKETSKWLFQYPLFKKDETDMPTTKLLLWQNSAISTMYHNEISVKVKDKFGIELPTFEEEQVNLDMAKKTIVDVVSQIKQYCRDDRILKQYNIEFGFCRNYLGAGVWYFVYIKYSCSQHLLLFVAVVDFSDNIDNSGTIDDWLLSSIGNERVVLCQVFICNIY